MTFPEFCRLIRLSLRPAQAVPIAVVESMVKQMAVVVKQLSVDTKLIEELEKRRRSDEANIELYRTRLADLERRYDEVVQVLALVQNAPIEL